MREETNLISTFARERNQWEGENINKR